MTHGLKKIIEASIDNWDFNSKMKPQLPIEASVKKMKPRIDYWGFSSKTETSIGICDFSLKIKSQLLIETFIKILKKKMFLWQDFCVISKMLVWR